LQASVEVEKMMRRSINQQGDNRGPTTTMSTVTERWISVTLLRDRHASKHDLRWADVHTVATAK